MQEIKEIKKQAIKKFCQGDVNIYKIPSLPSDMTGYKEHKSTIIVSGRGGNTHRMDKKPKRIVRTASGQFFMVLNTGAAMVHKEHKPITLGPGTYLIDQALEKGMFSDMTAPVVD